ncbi:MAG: hypothetical protein JWP85_725 [Rhodoglobus sp.]|nr:hypothetical protein [Rhodoglobus sp.]
MHLLEDPTRKPKRGPAQKALLSGIIRYQCGEAMTAEHSRGIYKCRRPMGTLRHQSVLKEEAEGAVTDSILTALMDGRLDGPEDLGELLEVQAKITANTRKLDAANDLSMDPDLEAWAALTVDRQRDIIKGSFVVSLKDGKGAERVSVEPV